MRTSMKMNADTNNGQVNVCSDEKSEDLKYMIELVYIWRLLEVLIQHLNLIQCDFDSFIISEPLICDSENRWSV